MIRWPKVLIAGLIVAAFGVATLLANGADRVDTLADELVEATAVLPENEGKLVIVSGTPELMDGGVLADEEAGLEVANAIYYDRIPYQKVYVEKTKEVVVDKGEDLASTVDDVTETRHYVGTEWIVADTKRDAEIYSFPEHYENPAPSSLSAYHASSDLRLSGFLVSQADVSGFLETQNHSFTQEELAAACEEYIIRSEIDLRPSTDENGCGILTSGEDVGDVQVYFSYKTFEGARALTLVGRQRGEQLVLEDEDLLSSSEHVRSGVVSREEFLKGASSEDSSSRIYGIGELVVGAVLVLLSLGIWRR